MKMISPTAHVIHDQQQSGTGYIKMKSAVSFVSEKNKKSNKPN